MNLPKDPFMLLSFINTQLRDHYKDLDSLSEDFDVETIKKTLQNAGFEYIKEFNQFR